MDWTDPLVIGLAEHRRAQCLKPGPASAPWVIHSVGLREARLALSRLRLLRTLPASLDLPYALTVGGRLHDLSWWPRSSGLDAGMQSRLHYKGRLHRFDADWSLDVNGVLGLRRLVVTPLGDHDPIPDAAFASVEATLGDAMAALSSRVGPYAVHRLAVETASAIRHEVPVRPEARGAARPKMPGHAEAVMRAGGQDIRIHLVSDKVIDIPTQMVRLGIGDRWQDYRLSGKVATGNTGVLASVRVALRTDRPDGHGPSWMSQREKAFRDELSEAARRYSLVNPAAMQAAAMARDARAAIHQAKIQGDMKERLRTLHALGSELQEAIDRLKEA